MGYSPQGRRELDTMKRLSMHTLGGVDQDQLRNFSHRRLRGRGQMAPESGPQASGLFPLYLVPT